MAGTKIRTERLDDPCSSWLGKGAVVSGAGGLTRPSKVQAWESGCEKNPGQALEAEFKNQLKVNVRNPALGLFVIGFAFFVLALYFAKPESESLILKGHINIAGVDGMAVSLKFEEPSINVSSEGEIDTTIQPVQNLWISIIPPRGYLPDHWSDHITSHRLKHGLFEIHAPEFRLAPEPILVKPKPGNPSKPIPPFK